MQCAFVENLWIARGFAMPGRQALRCDVGQRADRALWLRAQLANAGFPELENLRPNDKAGTKDRYY